MAILVPNPAQKVKYNVAEMDLTNPNDPKVKLGESLEGVQVGAQAAFNFYTAQHNLAPVVITVDQDGPGFIITVVE